MVDFFCLWMNVCVYNEMGWYELVCWVQQGCFGLLVCGCCGVGSSGLCDQLVIDYWQVIVGWFVVYVYGFFGVIIVIGYVVVFYYIIGFYGDVVVWFVGYVYGVGGVVFVVIGYVVIGDVV